MFIVHLLLSVPKGWTRENQQRWAPSPRWDQGHDGLHPAAGHDLPGTELRQRDHPLPHDPWQRGQDLQHWGFEGEQEFLRNVGLYCINHVILGVPQTVRKWWQGLHWDKRWISSSVHWEGGYPKKYVYRVFWLDYETDLEKHSRFNDINLICSFCLKKF